MPTPFRRLTALLATAALAAGIVGVVAIPTASAGPVLAPSPYALTIKATNGSPYFLNGPEGLALDANGNLFVANSNTYSVIKIAPNGTKTDIIGWGEGGDVVPGPAIDSPLPSGFPFGLAIDPSGNLYIPADQNLAKVTTGGIVSLVGSGFISRGVAADSSGNVYIADGSHHRVKKMVPGGAITTIAGTGTAGAPTAGTATSSQLNTPYGVAVDASGNVYIADNGNHMVEKVTPGGTLSIIAGTGTAGSPTAGNGTSSQLNAPCGIVVDPSGVVYVSDSASHTIVKLVSSVSAPAAPTSLSATPGDTTASISFTAGSDGGGAITKYQYTTNDGGSWNDAAAGTTSPISITGLTNGTNYSIKIRAYNSAGGGTASSAVSVTPTAAVAAPSAPTSLSATPGVGSASISFTAGFNGGASITKYQYTTNDGGSWNDAAAGTTSPISITGLTNGTTYSIKIRAYNSAGGGTASSAVSVTPRTTPSAPTSLIATPGDRSASIAFTPGFDGGSAIINYSYSLDGGANWAVGYFGNTSPISISGLVNGTTYTVRLRAINVIGNGAASTDVTVTPRTTPDNPTIGKVTLGNGSATIAVSVGWNGGSAITKYQYRVGTGSWVDAGSSSPITVTGLTNYTNNIVLVRAVNAAGASGTDWVNVRTRADAPLLTSATAVTRRGIRVNFTGVSILAASINGYDGIAYVKGTDTVASTCHVDWKLRTCDINNLNPNTEYDIRVVSFFRFDNAASNSETLESAATTVRTLS